MSATTDLTVDLLPQGVKYDDNKPRMGLCPQGALMGLAYAMTYGAEKYAAHNWAKGIPLSRTIDAGIRHLEFFLMGEDNDPESGMPHLWHALASIAMAHDSLLINPDLDDRCNYGVETLKRMREMIAQGADAMRAFKESRGRVVMEREALSEVMIEEPTIPEVRPTEPRRHPEVTEVVLPTVTEHVPSWVKYTSATMMQCARCGDEFLSCNEHVKTHQGCQSRAAQWATKVMGPSR